MYGVWGSQKPMGREYEGVHRTTFIIKESGIIEKIISKVDTKNHTDQIFIIMTKRKRFKTTSIKAYNGKNW